MKDKIFMILLGIIAVNLTIQTVKGYSCTEPKKYGLPMNKLNKVLATCTQ